MKILPCKIRMFFPLILLIGMTDPMLAQTDAERIEQLEAKTARIAQELSALRAELAQAKIVVEATSVETLRGEVQQTRQIAIRAANEWKNTSSVTHLAGYASADYIAPQGGNSAFTSDFNPMFHYMYDDRLLWESELAISLGDNGETEVELEYSTIDLFLNDNLILVAGKFLSPLGNFRQNLHPSWINKLTSAPAGFGHDGAAPTADIGVQLRGGMNVLNNNRVTYAAYVANGPMLVGEDGVVHGIETEGVANDADD